MLLFATLDGLDDAGSGMGDSVRPVLELRLPIVDGLKEDGEIFDSLPPLLALRVLIGDGLDPLLRLLLFSLEVDPVDDGDFLSPEARGLTSTRCPVVSNPSENLTSELLLARPPLVSVPSGGLKLFDVVVVELSLEALFIESGGVGGSGRNPLLKRESRGGGGGIW